MKLITHTQENHLNGNQTRDKEGRAAHPLVDGVVLTAMEPLFEVENPRGRAGVDVVVVEHAVHRYALSRSHNHFFRDVAHRWRHTHTHTNVLLIQGTFTS